MLKYTFTLSIILLITLSFACTQSDEKVNYPATSHLDSAEFGKVEKQFKVSCFKAPEYLGGLTPNYPVAIANQITLDINTGKVFSRDTDWVTGGFIPQANKIAIKVDNAYVLINNRTELQKTYAPITSTEEALAYAMLHERAIAVFADYYEKKEYRFVNKPEFSDVTKKGNNFIVTVFSYQTFGCNHPYYKQVIEVNKDGSVKLLSKKESFYDPKEDLMCLD